MFPTLCVDNFFENPNEIRKIALEQKFEKSNGDFPGERTDVLHIISPVVFNDFCAKLFSCYYDFDVHGDMHWNVTAYFQKIDKFSEDSSSVINSGWVHKDTNDSIMAGVVYLNEDSNPNAGTSLFRLKNGVENENHPEFDEWHNLKKQFYRGESIDLDLYKKYIETNHNMFVETARFSNIYNRMVCYNSEEYHQANSFYGDEPRLTLVFFVNRLMANGTPIDRMKKFSSM